MPNRREVLGATAGSALLLNFGGWLATPAQALEAGVKPTTLTREEFDLVGALGETLAVGARKAGIAAYLDQQLSGRQEDSFLMVKYLGVEPPFTGFYRGGLTAIQALSQRQHDKPFIDLSPDQQTALVASITSANPEGWEGPPAPFFYFVIRSDAVDVVYGTPDGFRDLGLPYMAHIVPPAAPWTAPTS